VLRVLRLLGAGEWFVRLPFVFEGLLMAAGTSLLALGVVEGASRLLARSWSDWSGMPLKLDLAFVAFALLLGFLGSLAGSAAIGHEETS
jgi:cell division protein FtsX